MFKEKAHPASTLIYNSDILGDHQCQEQGQEVIITVPDEVPLVREAVDLSTI